MPAPASDVILERMMALHPKVIDLTLDRMHRLLAALDHPERRLPPVIHVAGTNGKGSTQAMIRAGLEARGGRAHAYTSPHLARFHERIRLGGRADRRAALTALLAECAGRERPRTDHLFRDHHLRGLSGLCPHPPTGLLLEVGLGGRLDATNVVDRPALRDHAGRWTISSIWAKRWP
jgi:dihydrofolate synthase / folylpolyglutamate synthase